MPSVYKIIAKNNKYYGHEGIILKKTPHMFFMRLTDLELPIYSRFLVNEKTKKIYGTKSKFIYLYIKPSSVQQVKNKKVSQNPSNSYKETMKLLDIYANKTVKEVEKMIGHKLKL